MSNMQKTGRVYKMYFRDAPEDIYVGSTSQTLLVRMQNHKNAAKYETNKKSNWFEYLRSQDLSLLRIELLEEVKMNNKQDLLLVEDRYIRELKPKFNMVRAHLTTEEKKAYLKEYDAKPQRKERKKQYDATPQRKEYMKKLDAKPERKLKKKLSKQKNIDQRKYECIVCEVCFSAPYELNRHHNTKNHKNNLTLHAINELQQLTTQNLFN